MQKEKLGSLGRLLVLEFIVIVESSADYRIATDLATRIIVDKIEWIEPYLDNTIQWRGLQDGTTYSCWRDIGKIRKEIEEQGTIRLPRFLRRNSQPLKADGAAALQVLQLVALLQKNRQIRAVLFIRDLDNQPERRLGLEQAREEFHHRTLSIVTIIGTADTKREAWVLNGFEPLNEIEEAMLGELRKALGFDPTLEAHRLRSVSRQGAERTRNVKVIVEMLTGDGSEREAHCWTATDLNLLRQRGVNTGLTAYLQEVEYHLIPILAVNE
jgi:hypothetical protein